MQSFQNDQFARCGQSPKGCGHKDFILAALEGAGGNAVWILKRSAAALQDDRDIVLATVAQDPAALEYASVALQPDCELVAPHLGSADYTARWRACCSRSGWPGTCQRWWTRVCCCPH